MKGLIIKDICLMSQRKRFFIIMLGFMFFMNFYADSSFSVLWAVMLSVMFVISTFAYDEYDNCYPFLMTLPAERKDYALEKYAFGAITGAGALVLSLAISAVCCAVKGTAVSEMFESFSFMYILLPLCMLDLCIPINIKYGSEKGRLVLYLVFAALASVAVIIERSFPDYRFEANAAFDELGTQTILIFLAAAAFTLLSALISVRIADNKEY